MRSLLSRVTHAVVQSPAYYKGCKSIHYLHIPTKRASHCSLLSEDQKRAAATVGICATEFRVQRKDKSPKPHNEQISILWAFPAAVNFADSLGQKLVCPIYM